MARRMTALQRKYFGPRRRRRRRRRAVQDNRYRYRYRRNRVRRRRRVYAENPRGRPRRRYRENPYRRRYRYRRNIDGGAPTMARPQTWLIPALSAGTGAATAAAVTRMVLGPGAAPPMSYLVEGGTGLAGWMILPMTGLVRQSTGFFFFLGATVPIISDIVARYIFRALGLSAYTYDQAAELGDMGQEPRFPPTLSAYAYELGEEQYADDLGMADMGVYASHPAGGYGGAMPRAPWETAGPAGY